MVRIAHTSDWHLGRTLHGVDLLDHQAAYLDHLVELLRAEPVDALVVAGDVYDRAVPPVQAVALLSEALVRLCEATTVIVTSGNHDSARRLGFGAPLLRRDLRMCTDVGAVGEPVTIEGARGRALVYPLPYLDPDAVRRVLAPRVEEEPAPEDASDDGAEGAARSDDAVRSEGAEDSTGGRGRDGRAPREPGPRPGGLLPRSHEAVLAAAMGRVRADLARRGPTRPPAVVVAHAFVVGGEPSESERDIRVGGVDAVPAGVFAGVQYVALGHLHGPQRVGAAPTDRGDTPADRGGVPGTGGAASRDPGAGACPLIRYAGSPLAFSFSERHQHKSTALVDIADDGAARVELIPAPVPRRLAELRGPLEDLLGPAGAGHVADWVKVLVTDPIRPPDLFRRVRERYPHALVVRHEPDRPEGGESRTPEALRTARDPLEVAREFLAWARGQVGDPVDPLEARVLCDALERVHAAQGSR